MSFSFDKLATHQRNTTADGLMATTNAVMSALCKEYKSLYMANTNGFRSLVDQRINELNCTPMSQYVQENEYDQALDVIYFGSERLLNSFDAANAHFDTDVYVQQFNNDAYVTFSVKCSNPLVERTQYNIYGNASAIIGAKKKALTYINSRTGEPVNLIKDSVFEKYENFYSVYVKHNNADDIYFKYQFICVNDILEFHEYAIMVNHETIKSIYCSINNSVSALESNLNLLMQKKINYYRDLQNLSICIGTMNINKDALNSLPDNFIKPQKNEELVHLLDQIFSVIDLNGLSLNWIDTSAVTKIPSFDDLMRLRKRYINVDNLLYMDVDISKWDVSHVKSFSSMFKNAKRRVPLDLRSWDFSSATSTPYMFYGAEIPEVLISCMNLQNVPNTRIYMMFSYFKGKFKSFKNIQMRHSVTVDTIRTSMFRFYDSKPKPKYYPVISKKTA